MYISILKPLLMMFLVLLPFNTYSEIITEKSSSLMMDKSCLANGQADLTARFSGINAENANYVAIYGCFCAYKASQKNLLPAAAADFRNDRNCIPYAVLRNTIRYKTLSKSNAGANIQALCMASYPYDVTDDSKKEDVSAFCTCAATPVETLYSQIKPLKLSEEQIYEKLMNVINGCR